MSIWKYWDPLLLKIEKKIEDPLILDELDRMRDAIIWKRFRSANNPISQSSKSANAFDKILLNRKRDTPVLLSSYRYGTLYYLDYTTKPTSTNKTYRLENVDSNGDKINTDYVLLKLLAPAATGLFATLVGLGYISSRAYNKRKPFINL
jgi:hypothetical protein